MDVRRRSVPANVFIWPPLHAAKTPSMLSSFTLKADPSGYASFCSEAIIAHLICPFVDVFSHIKDKKKNNP